MSAERSPPTDTGYQLPNEWSQARRRLELLATTFDPRTIGRLETIGIKPGWRVLEVGGGGGSITRWLCDAVGPQGAVLSIDIDAHFIEEIERPQLQVRRADVTTLTLPEASFDLVHSRNVLAHLPGRDRLIGKLVDFLAPDGWLVVEEIDFFTVALDDGVWAEALGWYAATMAESGADVNWGRHLATRFDAGGLVDVQADAYIEFFTAASPRAELIALTFTQMWDKIRAAGARDGLREEFLAALADSTRRFPGTASIGARGRRP